MPGSSRLLLLDQPLHGQAGKVMVFLNPTANAANADVNNPLQ